MRNEDHSLNSTLVPNTGIGSGFYSTINGGVKLP